MTIYDDGAFERAWQKAINRLVESRRYNRDILWAFRDAVRPGSQVDMGRLPCEQARRVGLRTHLPSAPTAMYALLGHTCLQWWLCHSDVRPKYKPLHRRAAERAMELLWDCIKHDYTVVGHIRRGYRVKPNDTIKKTSHIPDKQEDNQPGPSSFAAEGKSGATKAGARPPNRKRDNTNSRV